MTPSPTLQRLQAEHPEWCFNCVDAYEPVLHGGVPCPYLPLQSVVAMKDAITALDAENADLRVNLDWHKQQYEALAKQEDDLVKLVPDKNLDVPGYIEQLKAQLAEREAQLEEADLAIIHGYDKRQTLYPDSFGHKKFKEMYQAALARDQARSKVRGSEETK